MRRRAGWILVYGLLLGLGLAATPAAQPLSNQVLALLTRINTWTAKNTFLDLRLNPGTPSDTTNRIWSDNAGNVYYGGIILGGASGATTPHNLLSSTHADTLTGTVVRGDVIVGNSTPKWSRLAIGTAGQVLASNGTDVVWSSSGAALTAIPAANLTGTAAAINGSAITALNASNLASGTVPLARLSGITTTQIDAAAAIPYSKLSLTGGIVNADVSASAAIAYSKLALTGALVNADLTNATLTFSKWASNSCTASQVPQFDGLAWGCATLGAGTGTVTSVGLSLPAIFNVSGSPVTTSDTLAVTLATETANTVWAGPTTGAAAAPTFRALVNADLPTSGVVAGDYTGKVTVNAQGVITAAVAALDLTADVGASILPRANGGTGVAVAGDDTVLIGSGTAWVAQTLPDCPTGALGYTQATNAFSCTSSGGPTHNLLSATHTDTVAASPVRGDLIVGNSTPKWTKLAVGTAGQTLTTDGTDPSWSSTYARGTIVASAPWTWTQTWNNGAVTFTAWLLNVTNTASAAASKLLDLQVGGSSKFTVKVDGTLPTVAGLTTAGNGVPVLVAATGLLSGQTANIAVTNLLASAPTGFYRACAFSAVTTAGGVSSTLPAVTISFNNGVAQTATLLASDSTNTTATYKQACMVLQASAATAITYDAGTTSGAYASSGTAMQYQLRVTLEALY